MEDLPKGCRARYDELIKRANRLQEQFYLGNRSTVAEELKAMEPLAATAVFTIMLSCSHEETRQALARWISEVA